MVLCGTLKTYKQRIYDATRTLNCPERRPPPTCPFIQPTMRKSIRTIGVTQRNGRTAPFPALTGRPEQCFFRDPVANPLVRLGVGGGLWASSQSPSTTFFRKFRLKPKLPEPGSEHRRRKIRPFSRPCLPPLLYGWTGVSKFEAPVPGRGRYLVAGFGAGKHFFVTFREISHPCSVQSRCAPAYAVWI